MKLSAIIDRSAETLRRLEAPMHTPPIETAALRALAQLRHAAATARTSDAEAGVVIDELLAQIAAAADELALALAVVATAHEPDRRP